MAPLVAALPMIATVVGAGASIATGVSSMVGAFKKPKTQQPQTPTTPATSTSSDTNSSATDIAKSMLISTSNQGILSSPSTGRNQLLGG